jgi:SAM-dependent methyltransferase
MATPDSAYSQAGSSTFAAQMATRTAEQHAALLLEHLQTGMHVLDVGCGGGSITIGIAGAVAPGRVVGIDFQRSEIDAAKARSAAHGVGNVEFQVVDVTSGVPFPDASFDAAFAHTVFMHLPDPVATLTELRRVLRPGGIVVVCDPDLGASLRVPTSDVMTAWASVVARVHQHHGTNGLIGRDLRRLLWEAGFVRAEAHARAESYGTATATAAFAAFLQSQVPNFARTALEQGWMDRATVDAVVADIESWAADRDAFAVTVWCEAIAWVDEAA